MKGEETINASLLVPENEVLKLKEKASIEYIAIQKNVEWKELKELSSDNENRNIICEAVTQEYFDIYPEIKEKLVLGRLFNEIDEKNSVAVGVIREDIALEILNTNECIGKKIMFNNQEIKIIGVLKANATEYEFPYVSDLYVLERYVSNSNDMELSNMVNYLIKPISNASRDTAIADIKNFLDEYLSADEYYIEQFYVSGEDTVIQVINLISITFLGIAGISIISGGIGIMNILLVSVNERVREIGIRRAIGATKKNIFLQFIIEGVIILLVSGIFAIVSAYGIIEIGNNFLKHYNIILQLKNDIILYIFMFCSCIGIIFSLYPAFKASKLNPVDALRC